MPGIFSSLTEKDDDFIYNREQNIPDFLVYHLKPKDDDVIIIGSDNEGLRIAEFGAKNAALFTIMNHEKHTHIK